MSPRRRGWNRRSLVLVATAVVGLAVAIAFRLAGSSDGGDLADIIGLPLTVASLVIGVFGVLARPREVRSVAEHAGRLAVAVRGERGRLRQRLLYGAESGLDVGFAVALGPDLVRWQQDGGHADGRLSDIHGYYLALDRGRLVVVGEAGAGKTVLAIELLLGLIDTWWDEKGQQRPGLAGTKVPVMVSLPSWDQGDTADIPDDELAGRLYAWLAGQIAEIYQVDREVAAELVATGWVLPILDGLDEMDEDPAQPMRAAAVVRAVNVAAGRRLPPVVLTCRRDEYDALAEYAGTGPAGAVHGATTVAVRPLIAAQIRAAVETAYATGDGVAPRWRSVCAELTARPDGPLAAALSTPWRLFLAMTVYRDARRDPGEMIELAAGDELVHALLRRFLPEVLVQFPPRPRADEDDVADWLRLMAEYLRWKSRQLGWSGTDLYPHTIWPIAGWYLPRVLHVLVNLVLLGVPTAIVVQLSGGPTAVATGLVRTVTESDLHQVQTFIPAILVLLIVFSSFQAWTVTPPLGQIDLTLLRTWTGWRPVLREIVLMARNLMIVPVGVGVGIWLLFDLRSAVVFGAGALLAMVLYSLAFGVVVGLTAYPERLRGPSDLIRGELQHGAVTAAVAGIALVLPFFLLGGPVSGIAFGVIGGWLALNNSSAGIRYLIAVAIMAARRQLPRRLGVFLDWAHQAGVLRLSGIACQFRHLELQHWLMRP